MISSKVAKEEYTLFHHEVWLSGNSFRDGKC